MNILSRILVVVILAAVSFTVHANLDEQFNEAQGEFLAIVEENSGSFEKAWTKFIQLDKQYPDHPAIQAYFGSLETLKARDSWMPWTKLKWVEQGLDRIDHALSLLDESHESEKLGTTTVALHSRIAAANTFLAIPSFLNRLQDAKDLFADLLDTPNLEHLPHELHKVIFTIGLDIAEKEGSQENQEKWQQKLDQLNLVN